MSKVIKDLSGMCDCLLIDTPPVLAVADAVTMARHADGVVVVARSAPLRGSNCTRCGRSSSGQP